MMKWFGIFIITILAVLEPCGNHPYAMQTNSPEWTQTNDKHTPLIFNLAMNDNQRRNLEKQLKVMSFEKRVALLIGNCDYQSAPLKNPINDVRLMERTLRHLGFETIRVENATQNQMKRQINTFGRKIREGGVGLFFYAGHGMQVKGRNYLIPVGAVIDSEHDVEYESVDVGRVLAKMEAAQNRLNIVILDACRNNPFKRSTRSGTRGLATVDAPRGTFIAYATGPGSVAVDGDYANSVFTQALADTIQIEGLKIEEVFKRIRATVRVYTNGQQIPWQSSSLEGDFYFSLPKQSTVKVPKHRTLPTF